MKFNSQICTTRKQSERLLSLGLKQETADMVWHRTTHCAELLRWELNPHAPILKSNTRLNIGKLNAFGVKNAEGKEMTGEELFDKLWGKDVPAWSLHRLIEMMPETIRDIIVENNYYPPRWLGFAKNNVALYDDDDSSTVQCWSSGNLYDDVIDCIEFLIDGEYFNKECLEE